MIISNFPFFFNIYVTILTEVIETKRAGVTSCDKRFQNFLVITKDPAKQDQYHAAKIKQ